MKVKYNKGGKNPVDPPQTSPDSKSTYKIGNMHFMGEEADRLIAFDEYLEKQFPNLDLFQRAEQVEKFLNANAHKSNEAMDSYSVDPSLAEEKASTISDMFESEFGSSMFGGSDPFDDDSDVQRMREEAASRENKKGKRNKRFENGGVTMKVKYGKGGSSDGMYAEAGALITGLAKNKELRDAMKAEIAKYEDGGSVTGGDKGKKKPGGGSTDMDKDAMDPDVVGKQVTLRQDQVTFRADTKPAEGITREQLVDYRMQAGEAFVNRVFSNAAVDKNKMLTAFANRSTEGLSNSEKRVYQEYKQDYINNEYKRLKNAGVLVTQYVDKKTGEPASDELIESMEKRGLKFTYDPNDVTNKTYIIGKK